MPDIDILIAFGLIIIVIFIFIVYRIGILPKKSLPYVFGALAAVFGISIFRQARLRGLREDLKKKENELQAQEAQLEELKRNYEINQEQLDAVRYQLEQQKAAYKKMMLKIDAEKTERHNEIENLSGEELDAAFDDLLKRLGD
jgi:septal ring factor EnvC (AmiA/AmiB activator)